MKAGKGSYHLGTDDECLGDVQACQAAESAARAAVRRADEALAEASARTSAAFAALHRVEARDRALSDPELQIIRAREGETTPYIPCILLQNDPVQGVAYPAGWDPGADSFALPSETWEVHPDDRHLLRCLPRPGQYRCAAEGCGAIVDGVNGRPPKGWLWHRWVPGLLVSWDAPPNPPDWYWCPEHHAQAEVARLAAQKRRWDEAERDEEQAR